MEHDISRYQNYFRRRQIASPINANSQNGAIYEFLGITIDGLYVVLSAWNDIVFEIGPDGLDVFLNTFEQGAFNKDFSKQTSILRFCIAMNKLNQPVKREKPPVILETGKIHI